MNANKINVVNRRCTDSTCKYVKLTYLQVRLTAWVVGCRIFSDTFDRLNAAMPTREIIKVSARTESAAVAEAVCWTIANATVPGNVRNRQFELNP